MGQSKKKGRTPHATMRYEIESMLKQTLGQETLATQEGHLHTPQADVYETANEIIILMDLPGIPKENIDLYVYKDRVLMEARKKGKKAPKNARFHCIERYFGKFQRSIDIPVTVHTGKVEAHMQNGVLIICLPKIVDRRGQKKRVEVK